MIRFREEDHSYFNEQDERYLSVSGVAKLLEVKKDWDEILRKKAKKLKIKPEILKAEWERKRIAGTNAGTAYHLMREQELLNSNEPTIKNFKCSLKPCSFSNGWKYSLIEQKLENNTIYPEAILFDHDLKIAGQADKVIVINNTIIVEDLKTDKKIDRQAYSSEYVDAEKLLAPVDHLDNCEYNVYSLKMSMYMFLLWKQNKHLKTGELILEWVQLERDEDTVPILGSNGLPIVKKIERIEVPYRRQEVKDIFDWYKKGKLK